MCWIEVLLKSQGNPDLHPRYRAMLTSFLWENVTGECVLADSFVMLLLLLTNQTPGSQGKSGGGLGGRQIEALGSEQMLVPWPLGFLSRKIH